MGHLGLRNTAHFPGAAVNAWWCIEMKCSIKLEHYEWPIFKVEPYGFDYIEVSLSEPSCSIAVVAIIPLQDALNFGERLITLSQCLLKAGIDSGNNQH